MAIIIIGLQFFVFYLTPKQIPIGRRVWIPDDRLFTDSNFFYFKCPVQLLRWLIRKVSLLKLCQWKSWCCFWAALCLWIWGSRSLEDGSLEIDFITFEGWATNISITHCISYALHNQVSEIMVETRGRRETRVGCCFKCATQHINRTWIPAHPLGK